MLPIAPVLPAAPALPPLLLAFLLACTAWGLAIFNIIPAPNFLGGMVYLSSLSAVLGVSGAAIIAAAFIQFRLKKTSVNPRRFSKNNTLIVSGVFAFTRNPIYLGMLLMLISWVIYLADLIAAVAPLIFFLVD